MGADSISLVSALIEAGNVDTVYRDVYLARARTLLDPALPLEEFHRIEASRTHGGVVSASILIVTRATEDHS
jgi:hypothetical protein